jgi:cytochrome c oxidase cbb3-type subunit 3
MGVMPAWGQALGEQGVRDVTHYVRSLSGLVHDSIRAAFGKEHFDKNCTACHGPQGKGNPAMGAPDLTDNVWLHGSSEELIRQTISRGRVDQMPAHKEILSSAQIHLLTAYVYSLSRAGATTPHTK